MFLVDTLGRAVLRPCPTRLERMSEVVRHVSLPTPHYSEAVMQHSDITVPTVTRRKGEPLDVWHERKRAARRQRNREDAELARLAERHDFATLDAVSAAIFGGQR